MGSTGRTLGFVVGAVAGFFTGGLSTAWTYGMYGLTIGGIIDPPKGPHLYGPRLDDLSVQTSTYGVPVSRLYGTIAVTGNIIYLEHNRLREVSTTTRVGKGGGQKQTTFAYYATFAVGLCEGPVTAVRRIWIGDNLIYDAGATELSAILASNKSASGWKLYTGEPTQQPDSRMEAVKGVGNTPAYRGLAYLMFYDLALADYGNTIAGAQIKAEVVQAGSIDWHVDTLQDVDAGGWVIATLWTDEESLYWIAVKHYNFPPPNNIYRVYRSVQGGPAEILEEAPYSYSGDYSVSPTPSRGQSSAPVLFLRWGVHGMTVYDARERRMYTPTPPLNYSGPPVVFGVSGDRFYVVGGGPRFHEWPYLNADQNATPRSMLLGFLPFSVGFTDSHYFLSEDFSYGTSITIHVIDRASWTISSHTFTGLGAVSYPLIYGVHGKRAAILARGQLFTFDGGTLELVTSSSIPQFSSTNAAMYFSAKAGVAHSTYITDYGSQSTQATLKYGYSVLSDAPVPLAEIIEAESLKSNLLQDSDLDLSDLNENVRGYRIASVSAIRGGLDQLQGAWPFDVVQSGYKIRFNRRGKTSMTVIPSEKLGAVSSAGQSVPKLSNSREMDSVLPSRVTVKYLDPARDYDQGEQAAERINTPSVNAQSVDMAVVLTADEAAQVADVLLYMYWLERYDVKFTLPPEYLFLEPSDVVTVEADGASYELRLTAITYTAEGAIECQAKYNNAAIYTSTAQGAAGSSTSQGITLSGPTRYELLDIPTLADQFDQAGWPLAMTGFAPGWPGGVLMRSDDSGQTWTDVAGVTNPGAIMGQATSGTLAAAPSDRIDKVGQLIATLSRDVFSVTELQMLNGQNHFAYGRDGRWEIIAAQNCVQNIDGSYTLTDFLRGRFGTEWATGLHQAFDSIVSLNVYDLQWVGMNINTIGLLRSWRGVTLGAAIDSDSNRDATYRGVNLKPLAPVYLNGNRASNNWSLSWIRRTRIGGELRDGVDVPLGEASEAYDVEIYDGSGYATVKRTISVSSPTASYSSADQTTDFGSAQSILYLKIYQKSATIGRGYPLQASISR